MRTLAAPEAAYLAGLIDGEGTIALSRRHARDQRQLVVAIASTEASIVERVRHLVGAGKITRKRPAKAHHAQGLCFSVSNRQALSLLAQTASFLVSYKKARAELVLNRYLVVTPRNGKYSAALLETRAEFLRQFAAILPPSRPPRQVD